MKCVKCETEIRDGLTFCPACGVEFAGQLDLGNGQKNSMTKEAYITGESNKDEKEKKLYEKAWLIIILLILLWPVGLFLMWKYATWNKIVKITISIIIILCVSTYLI